MNSQSHLYLASTEEIVSTQTSLQHLWLEITEKCNLSCSHCYAESSPHLPLFRDMQAKDWILVLHQAHSLNCKSVQFIGGEPTLHPDLDYLLQEACSLGFDVVEVYTNGTALTAQRIERYKSWGIKVALSFYSTNADVHDQITQRKGSFDKTINGIQRALEAGLDIRIGIVQSIQTDDEIAQVYTLLNQMGINNIGHDRVRKIGRGQGITTVVTPEETMSELCGACHQGKACVTPTGDLFPCIMARTELLGNIKKQSLQSILDGDLRYDFIERQVSYLSQKNNNSSCSPHCTPYQCDPQKTKSPAASEEPCGPHCVPQYGNCGPTKAN